MPRMRPHQIVLGALVLSALSCAAGCGGSTQSAAAPETPAGPAATETKPADDAKPADTEPASSATPTEGAASSDTGGDSAAAAGDPDKRTMEIIAATVKEHRKDARACYEKGAKEVAGLKGDLVVHFILKPNGKVKSAELNHERSTITEASVVKCVIDVVSAIDFPKSSRGMETTVNYPFNFTP
jgi:hypothetical protein